VEPGPPAGATLAARIAERDRAAFAGRRRELRIVDALFADDSPASVLLVHGPGGIGKSALLREIGRRGERAGWFAVRVDGRELAADPDALEEGLADAWTHERPLILVDGYEAMAGLERHLRAVLPSLPHRAVVVIAGRRPPDRGWFEHGWEAVAVSLRLGPLPPDEAHEVLARQGLGDDRRLPILVRWSGGWPLALRMAGDIARANPCWLPESAAEPGDRPAAVDAEAVREALRLLHVPAALAQSPLARGRGMRERAESVRAQIADAAEHAFGETPDERFLRQVLVRGYLDPAASHEQAAAELHVSRSTYFRRLKVAAERVASYVVAHADRRREPDLRRVRAA
jgi:hypothetical protein